MIPQLERGVGHWESLAQTLALNLTRTMIRILIDPNLDTKLDAIPIPMNKPSP